MRDKGNVAPAGREGRRTNRKGKRWLRERKGWAKVRRKDKAKPTQHK